MEINQDLQSNLDLLNEALNKEQKLAAETTEGPVIVIAGAGAGKTKTLIHRVATLMLKGVPPTNIMVVTFTNKAAGEIKDRLEMMVGEAAQYVTAGTFHSVIYHKILKKYPESSYLRGLGIDMEFCSIIDDSDAKSLLDAAIKSLSEEDLEACEDGNWGAGMFSKAMGLEKAQGRDLHEVAARILPGDSDEGFKRVMVNVWMNYSRLCREAAGIDFDDILLIADKMLKREPHIGRELSEVYQYLMLDEYQDTNRVQMSIMDSIAKHHTNIFVVGDEKQSIYKFRGSEIGVILSFKNRYSGAKQIVMHRNYRSFPNIIKHSNACAHSMREKLSDGQLTSMAQIPPERLEDPLADKVSFLKFRNEEEEAKQVTKAIARDLAAGVPGSEIAVLYRNRNAKVALEKEIWEKNILYHVVGDTAFFKRTEVKSVVAMVRFMFNPWDSMAGLRMLDATTVSISSDRAKRAMQDDGMGVMALLRQEAEKRIKITKSNPDGELAAVAKKVAPLVELSDALRDAIKFQDNGTYITDVLMKIWDIYMRPGVERISKKSGDPNELDERVANVSNVLERIEDQLNSGKSIEEIIDELTLMIEHNPDLDDDMERRVRLMTIHASKGLEFDNVYLIGADDQTLPGDTEEAPEIEEARRLVYVAITRAKQKVAVTYAKNRLQFGQMISATPSRFTEEIASITGSRIIDFVPPKSPATAMIQDQTREKAKSPALKEAKRESSEPGSFLA